MSNFCLSESNEIENIERLNGKKILLNVKNVDNERDIYILNFESYNSIQIFPEYGTCPARVLIIIGNNKFDIEEPSFYEFQKFLDLNELLDLDEGKLESMLLLSKYLEK